MMINLGIDASSFQQQYYERQLFLKRAAFIPQVTLENINDVLFSWDPGDGRLNLFSGDAIPRSAYTETLLDIGAHRTRIIKDELYAHLRKGASLVLNRLELKMRAVHAITTYFAKFIGEQAAANGYLSFGGKGAFNRHWDTHDVFVVQLIGRKQWKVFRPTLELPMPMHKSAAHRDDCPSTPVFDGHLDAGDVLYIPRGWWHEACAFPGEETFHVAIGVHGHRMIDYAVFVCMNVLPKYIEARTSFRSDSSADSVEPLARIVASEMLSARNIEEFKSSVCSQERVESEFDLKRLAGSSGAFDFDTAVVNSVYKRPLFAERSVINGLTISMDKKTSAALQSAFDSDGSVRSGDIDDRARKLISELIRRDVLSTPRETNRA